VSELTLQTPRSVQKQGRRCSRHQSRDSPADHGADPGKAGCAPAALGGPRWSRSPPAARGDPTPEQADARRRLLSLWGARAGAGYWQDL